MKFDDDCFKNFSYGAADHWEACIRAVGRTAQDHSPYLETTYRDARNRVAYCMK